MEELPYKYKFTVSMLNKLSRTWRIKFNSSNSKLPEEGIIVFWHGFMLPVWKKFSSKKPYAVVSLSRDGEVLSQLLKKWNFKLIRGSSSKKGREVLNEIVDKAPKNLILMTPDGPRGPIYKMKAGAALAAFRAGVPLYLCGVDIKKSFTFNKSWDKFSLPMPFSKIILTLSKPIDIQLNDEKNDLNELLPILESELISLYPNLYNDKDV